MTGARKFAALREMLAGTTARLEMPTVDVVVPVIRSGDQMLIRQPGEDLLTQVQRRRLRNRQDPSDSSDDNDARDPVFEPQRTVLLGDIVVEFGFDPTGERDLQDLLEDYEDRLARGDVPMPPGVRYRGTYAVYSSSEKSAGKYRTVWSFKGKAALQRMMAEGEADSRQGALGVTEFGAIVRRLRVLADTRPGAGRSQNWYQPAWGFRR